MPFHRCYWLPRENVTANPEDQFAVELEEKIRNSEQVVGRLLGYGEGGKQPIFEATTNTSPEVQGAARINSCKSQMCYNGYCLRVKCSTVDARMRLMTFPKMRPGPS